MVPDEDGQTRQAALAARCIWPHRPRVQYEDASGIHGASRVLAVLSHRGPCELEEKIVSAVLSLIVLTGVSLSWALAVDYTSADSRPYVGSSQTNSVLELAFGYNGTERLLGQTTATPAAI